MRRTPSLYLHRNHSDDRHRKGTGPTFSLQASSNSIAHRAGLGVVWVLDSSLMQPCSRPLSDRRSIIRPHRPSSLHGHPLELDRTALSICSLLAIPPRTTPFEKPPESFDRSV
ncbi:hypothetical protein DSL92_04430 [Billgrantia gudaonensis]|uniref:Uncharacterized protein n=1 Tax=Billgrantia gudaonensis TaxID=376427 RepID=A0A3S0Q1B4_9GAMM|nr:hypothetical protein DSL92_04430 [Halomonas gudaonensis]